MDEPGCESDVTPTFVLIFWETYLGCAPSIINAVRSLSDAGHRSVLFIRQSDGPFVDPPDLGELTRLLIVDLDNATVTEAVNCPTHVAAIQESRVRGLARRFVPPPLRRPLGRWVDRRSMDHSNEYDIEAIDRFHDLTLSWIAKLTPKVIVGVDTVGIGVAKRLTDHYAQTQSKSGPELWYWSLEIMADCDRTGPVWKELRRREREAHAASDLTIIQDEERWAQLRSSNNLSHGDHVIVPNSPRGILPEEFGNASKIESFKEEYFGIGSDRRVVLHAGSISEGMRSAALAQSAKDWPEPFDLVFHSHSTIGRHDSYARSVIEHGGDRVHLSTMPVDYDQLDTLYSAADVAVAIYDPNLGPNFRLLAGASGKLTHALKCGIPVISVGNPSIARILDRYGCGVGVDDVQDVGTAITEIRNRWRTYHEHALDCFARHYEFDRHFEKAIHRVSDCQPDR